MIESRIVKEIVGHEKGDVTGDVYGHTHDYNVLKEIVDSIDFGIKISGLRYDRFLARRRNKN